MSSEFKDHICKDRSSWLSMKNTGLCSVELRHGRAYLRVIDRMLESNLVRIYHCPFCGTRLGRRKKKKLRNVPTGLHARLLRKS